VRCPRLTRARLRYKRACQACASRFLGSVELPDQGEEAFDAAEVEFDGGGHGDDGVVDVGGKDLPLGPPTAAPNGRRRKRSSPRVGSYSDAT
jgi:hypothetical protein